MIQLSLFANMQKLFIGDCVLSEICIFSFSCSVDFIFLLSYRYIFSQYPLMLPLKKKSKKLNPLPLYYKLLISKRVTCENQIMLTRKRYISVWEINPGVCPCDVALLTASALGSVYIHVYTVYKPVAWLDRDRVRPL